MVYTVNGKVIKAELLFDETAPSGGQANFDFQSIPSSYNHLQVTLHGKTEKVATDSDSIYCNVNNDTTDANYVYAYHVAGGTAGGTHVAANGANRTAMELGSSKTAVNIGEGVMFVLGYTSPFYKMIRSAYGVNFGGLYYTVELVNFWLNVAIVNRLTFVPVSGNDFAENSRCSIYGFR